jgi:hypothetical protein
MTLGSIGKYWEKKSRIIPSFANLAVCLMTIFQIPPLDFQFLFEIYISAGVTASLTASVV